MTQGHPGEQAWIQTRLDCGQTDRYPRARIYDSAGTLVETLDLTHVLDGWYRAAWVVTKADRFMVLVDVYSDAGRTTLDPDITREAYEFDARAHLGPDIAIPVAHDDDTLVLRGHVWLFRDGAAVTDATSATVTVHNPDGTLFFTLSLGVPDRQASGAFRFERANTPLLDNQTMVATVSVTDPLGTVTKTRGLYTVR